MRELDCKRLQERQDRERETEIERERERDRERERERERERGREKLLVVLLGDWAGPRNYSESTEIFQWKIIKSLSD